MARSFVVIQQQIAKLQKEAESLKKKEIPGVIERIKTAIAFYGLTPADLFTPDAAATRKTGPKAKPPKVLAKKKERAAPVIKFQDGSGNSWTGHGKRPAWFKAAIEAGKTADDLKVVPATETPV